MLHKTKLDVSENIADVSERILRYLTNKNNYALLIEQLILYIQSHPSNFFIKVISFFSDPQKASIAFSKKLISIKDAKENENRDKEWLATWLDFLHKPWQLDGIEWYILNKVISNFTDYEHKNTIGAESLILINHSLHKRGLIHLDSFEKQKKINAELKTNTIPRSTKRLDLADYSSIVTILENRSKGSSPPSVKVINLIEPNADAKEVAINFDDARKIVAQKLNAEVKADLVRPRIR